MTDIQSGPGATVAMTVSGIPFIRADSGSLIQDGHCVLKVLTLNGQRLVDNTVRFFNVLAAGASPGNTVAEAVDFSAEPYIQSAFHPDRQQVHPWRRFTRALKSNGNRNQKDSPSWRLFSRQSRRKQPSFKMMMAEFVLKGHVELLESYPRYEERKAFLISKGFHFDGKLKAWILDPHRKPVSV